MSGKSRLHDSGIFLFALLGLTLFVGAGCSSTELIQSERADTDLKVNGSLADWYGNLNEVKDQPALFGVRHDDENAYLAFSTSDANLMRQILVGGLVVWFNTDGDETEQLGIKFPIGRTPGEGQNRQPRAQTGEEQEPGRPPFLSEFEVAAGNEILGRYSVDDGQGIVIDAYIDFESFIYELSVPLRSSTNASYAIEIGDDGLYSLGFKTGEVTFEGEGRQPTGGGGGRGGGGRRGGGGGRGGGGQGPGAGGAAPLDFWVNISTVNPPS